MSDKNTVRVLSSSVVVSSLLFGKLSASKQTEILANSGGKPIVFVDSFGSFTNKDAIIKKLLAGEDVSVELEFNEIALDKKEIELFTAIRPVIERIRGAKLTGGYEYLDPNGVEDLNNLSSFRFWVNNLVGTNGSTSLFRNSGGYNVTKAQFEKVWAAASRFWYDGTKPASAINLTFNYDRRALTLEEDKVKIGCQSATRAQVEAIARKFKIEPSIG